VARFEPAVEHTFGAEGGFTGKDGLPHDSGGPTNMGVTLGTLQAVLRLDQDGDGWADGDFDHDGAITWKDVELLPREVARERVYRPGFWDRPGFAALESQLVAIKAFDLAVHAGPRAAVAVLQRAVNEARPAGVAVLRIDGRLGPQTVAAAGRCDEELLLRAFAAEQASFYLGIIEEDPGKAAFRRNWLARARWPFVDSSGNVGPARATRPDLERTPA
jgi:lysozyme family protein